MDEIQEVIEEQEVVQEAVQEETSEENQEVEPWMVESEEQETVPVGAHASMKRKLKGKVAKRDEEIERLRLENEQLKQAKPSVDSPKRPRPADFDTDEEYDKALDNWYEGRQTVTFQTLEQQREQKEKALRFRQTIERSVNDHYERAGKLIQDNTISSDVYQHADQAVREATEAVMPKHGGRVVDQLINALGEGSEKVMFYLGRNKTELAKYQALLSEDPGGLKASAFLGRLIGKVSGKQNTRSRAPAPAPSVNGDASASANEASLKKKYNEAHKKGEAQAAYNLKKQAVTAGFDTSKW